MKTKLNEDVSSVFQKVASVGVAGPGAQYIANPQYRQIINQNVIQPIKQGAQAGIKMVPAVNLYNQYKGEKPTLNTVGQFAKGVGALTMGPTNYAIGGGIGMLLDKDRQRGMQQGISFSQQIAPLGNLFSPVARNVGSTSSQIVSRIAPKTTNILTKVVPKISGGIAEQAAIGGAYGALTGQNPIKTAVEFAPYGALGAVESSVPNAKGFTMGKQGVEDLANIEDRFLNPQKYATVKGKLAVMKSMGLAKLSDKQYHEMIKDYARREIDNLAVKYLPNQEFDKTLGNTKAIIKKLVDLSEQNKLGNFPVLGIADKKSGVSQAGLYDTKLNELETKFLDLLTKHDSKPIPTNLSGEDRLNWNQRYAQEHSRLVNKLDSISLMKDYVINHPEETSYIESQIKKIEGTGTRSVSFIKQLEQIKPELNVAQQPITDITQNSMIPVGDILASKEQIKAPLTSKDVQSNAQPIIPPKNATPEQVAASLPSKIDNFIQDTLGYSTQTPTGGTRQASGYTKILRSGQEAITRKVEQGMASENPAIRTAASTLQNFFRGLGMSPERANASMELRGGISAANDRAFNVMQSLYDSIGHNKASLEKINAVLDPELAKTKVSLKQLSPEELAVYKIIKNGFDLVHDTSYASGAISPELYAKNQGKYTPRLYDVFEVPPEVQSFLSQGKKLANDLYKSRDVLNDWKIEHSLNDPVYSLGKRLAQVQTNTAIKKYTDFLAGSPNLISDIERPGFTKLSDSPAYGSLKGKYVLNSAAEDLKGFFFSNQATQKLYDVFRAYDRMPVRQLQKKLLTVFNPTTNVGNIVSDQVFGFLTGVDPYSLNKNLVDFKKNPSEFKQLNDYLLSKGVTGTDITRTDFINKMGEINSLAEGKKSNVIKIVADKIQSFYGGTDDVYKVSALKSLLDKGFTLEEATRKVADGFQNYANVGKFYDVWAKTPVVGSAFIKFQGDLIRIIKNGAVNNPLGLITFLGTLEGISLLSSKLSGESKEDYKTRTERFAAPMIPGLNIPLTWQTPIGEINVARYISPFYANNETTNLAKMLPFVPNINPNKDVASNIAMNANDPFLSTPLQLLVNRDFRGKPISDPNENKYQPSTLTPAEKLTNQAIFTGRAYTPPLINSVIDVASAFQGKPNMYGAVQTPGQAIARLGGIKIQQFGPQQAQETRNTNAYFDALKQQSNSDLTKQVNSDLLKGKIDAETANKRINYLSGGTSQDTTQANSGVIEYQGKYYANIDGSVKGYDTQDKAKEALNKNNFDNSGKSFDIIDNKIYYKNDAGDVKTMDAEFNIPEAPKLTGSNELDKKIASSYKSDITSAANDVVKRYELGVIDQNTAESQLQQLKNLTTKVSKPKKISIKFTKPKTSKIKISYPKLKAYKVSTPKITKTKSNVAFKIKQPKKLKIA